MEIPVTIAVLQVGHPKLEILVGDVFGRRCLRVVGEDVVALDAPVHGREGNAVAVERRTPLVIHRAVGGKIWLGRVLATFETRDSAFDGFDRSANPLLDEVGGKVGFVAESVVEGAFGFGFGGHVVAVVAVPAPFARGVGAMFELLDRLSKGVIGSFGSVEFDDGGTTVFHCGFTYSGSVTYMVGDRLAIVARFVSSGVGFLPDLKGRGILLVPPVKLQLQQEIAWNHWIDWHLHQRDKYVSDTKYQSSENLPHGFQITYTDGGPTYEIVDVPLASWHREKAIELLEESYENLVEYFGDRETYRQ